MKEGIPSKETIECRTFSKTIDYSTITYSNKDIEIAKQDNFCGKFEFSEESVSEQQCLNGVVLTDLAQAGEKCCFIEANLKKINYKFTHCFSLSQTQRDNINSLQEYLLKEDVSNSDTAKLICNGFNKQYSFMNGLWVDKKDSDNI